MIKAIPMEDWLRGCIYHDGRNGYVNLPTDKVHQIANYIQRTRRSGADGLIDLEVVEPHIVGKHADAIIIDESNCSEIPNNCETCRNWDIVNDHCYFIQECRYEPKTEPQTDCDGCIYANGDSMFACVSCKGKVPYDGYEWDEPQTDCAWGKGE